MPKSSKALQEYRKNPNTYVGVKFINNIMPWIERYYHAHKMFPTDSLLMTQFSMTQEKLQTLQKSPLFKEACEQRGIVKRQGVLDPSQVAVVALLTNTMDTRPIEVKLASVNVSPEQYQGWMSNPTFRQEMFVRSEEILDNLSPVAHASLAKEVQKGNVSALRMYYEMTGRSKSPEIVNAQRLVQTILEALQKHVKDPQALNAISREILGEAPELAKVQVVSSVDTSDASPVAKTPVVETEEQ